MSNSTLLKDQDRSAEVCGVRPGALDGLTIMRYGPIYRERSNGGVEQYLRCLNRGLLLRHRLNVLQVQRVSDVANCRIEIEDVGMGRIVWIPVPFQRTPTRFADLPRRARFVCRQTLSMCMQNGDDAPSGVFNSALAVLRNELNHLPHRSIILSDFLPRMLLSRRVDLLAIHGLTYDAGGLISQAKKVGIPFVLINHFYNVLFSQSNVRKWAPHAAGIGAVSGRGVPDHVRGQCVNLLDGIDTEYFAPQMVRPRSLGTRPKILLPALIKPGKGHEDMVQVARILATRNLDFQICFAGWAESESLHQALRAQVASAALEQRIVFLGELQQHELRDQYALCDIVVLPTYCEGLGRTLLEAQAMEKPVVAYDSGGVPDTLLPNETGFLVKTGDVETLADRLEFLLLNEAERQRMGKQGRQFVVEKFSLPALIQRHESFYLTALAGHQRLFPKFQS